MLKRKSSNPKQSLRYINGITAIFPQQAVEKKSMESEKQKNVDTGDPRSRCSQPDNDNGLPNYFSGLDDILSRQSTVVD